VLAIKALLAAEDLLQALPAPGCGGGSSAAEPQVEACAADAPLAAPGCPGPLLVHGTCLALPARLLMHGLGEAWQAQPSQQSSGPTS
jgi:hypothetical protein